MIRLVRVALKILPMIMQLNLLVRVRLIWELVSCCRTAVLELRVWRCSCCLSLVCDGGMTKTSCVLGIRLWIPCVFR